MLRARVCVCVRVHIHTHVTMPVCFILTANANKSEKMMLTVSWQRRKFMESPLFCWSQSHNCINCWAKRPWWRFPWCRVTQRWRSEYCSVFFFIFKAFGIQATQKMQDKKSVSYYLVHVYLCCLRRVDCASSWCSGRHFHLAARIHNIILNSLPLRLALW